MAKSSGRRVDLSEKIPVRIESTFHAGKGLLLNVSSTGAYIATPMVLLPQAQVRLQIVLREERRWVETNAVVAWENRGTVERRDNLPPGYGFRFVDIPEETAAFIEKLLTPEPPEPQREAPAASPEAVHEDPDDLIHDDPDVAPYRLRTSVLERRSGPSPGIFVLSYDRTQEARVGRADESLRDTLASFEGQYAYFYCETIESLDERFFRECELYHRLGGDHGQLDNTEHPSTPQGSGLDCPICVTESVG